MASSWFGASAAVIMAILLAVQHLYFRQKLKSMQGLTEDQKKSERSPELLFDDDLDDDDEELQSGGINFVEQYLDCILDSMTSGVIVFDVLSRFILLNKEAETILKHSATDLVGTMLMEYPNLFGLFQLINSVRGSRPMVVRSNGQFETVISDFKGNSLPLGVSINALIDSEGRVMGYVLICKDLTERKRMVEELERAEKLSALGTMASGVAHNFNNILVAILGRVQLLLRYPDKAKIVEGLKTIEKSALDGAATVKRIQDFARKRPVNRPLENTDVNGIIEDVIQITTAKWKRDHNPVKIKTRLKSTARVSAVPSELREVFINLVLNAVDAMSEGGTLEFSTENDKDNVSIQVLDSGMGISEDVRTRIFDPFFTTKGANGTGLGLSESYGIIKRHSGLIRCKSKENKGTVFTITLPLTRETGDILPDESNAKVDRKLSILVVDDDKVQCQLLMDILSAEGHSVEIATGGKDAIQLLSGHKFDVIISDIAMPGVDGWDVISAAKELPDPVKTILISGLGDAFDGKRCRKEGVDLYLSKPVALDALLSALAKLFG